MKKGIIPGIVIGIVSAWLISMFALHKFFPDLAERGTFGDSFGAINALFSGLALAGVIVAILMQRAELALQRKELELTRRELKRSAEASETSAEALKLQTKVDLLRSRISASAAILDSLGRREEQFGGHSEEHWHQDIGLTIEQRRKQIENELDVSLEYAWTLEQEMKLKNPADD